MNCRWWFYKFRYVQLICIHIPGYIYINDRYIYISIVAQICRSTIDRAHIIHNTYPGAWGTTSRYIPYFCFLSPGPAIFQKNGKNTKNGKFWLFSPPCEKTKPKHVYRCINILNKTIRFCHGYDRIEWCFYRYNNKWYVY